ncbi:molybdenum cofactor guanylyltransferase [Paenibacillus agaridevorans]|nr:molybdenum cofactor guanylyltransferase [Paenibacillus agaridevorans]
MLSGVILAGGHHRRMKGENRAFLLLEGRTLLERQISAMRTCCNEITIVANDPQPFLRAVDRDIRIITDYYTDKGVLSGMHAGLALAQNQNVWVVGCHMPFPSADAAMLLQAYKTDHVDAVIPWVDKGAFPLHGIYDRSCARRIGEQLNEGDSYLSRFLNRLNWIELSETAFLEKGVGCHFTKTIHSPEDYYSLTNSFLQHEFELLYGGEDTRNIGL